MFVSNPTPCRACRAEIRFVQTEAARSMPVEALVEWCIEVAGGRDTVVRCRDGSVTHGIIVRPGREAEAFAALKGRSAVGPFQISLCHVPHWQNCPNKDEFRKRPDAERER